VKTSAIFKMILLGLSALLSAACAQTGLRSGGSIPSHAMVCGIEHTIVLFGGDARSEPFEVRIDPDIYLACIAPWTSDHHVIVGGYSREPLSADSGVHMVDLRSGSSTLLVKSDACGGHPRQLFMVDRETLLITTDDAVSEFSITGDSRLILIRTVPSPDRHWTLVSKEEQADLMAEAVEIDTVSGDRWRLVSTRQGRAVVSKSGMEPGFMTKDWGKLWNQAKIVDHDRIVSFDLKLGELTVGTFRLEDGSLALVTTREYPATARVRIRTEKGVLATIDDRYCFDFAPLQPAWLAQDPRELRPADD
jgi:hypothetical protein